MNFSIPKQTEAEHDKFLNECFHDANFISDLLEGEYSIVSGRKGTGKTALAKYLQTNYSKYNIFFTKRMSVDEISYDGDIEQNIEIIVFYILIKTIQTLLSKPDIITDKARDYWDDFLSRNGLASIDDYRSYTKWKKDRKASFVFKDFGVGGSSEYKQTNISNSSAHLFPIFKQSIQKGKKIFIFIDDVSDYLDRTNSDNLMKQLDVIRDLLLLLDKYNIALKEEEKDFYFITCVRDDIFDFMEGSNINKLKNNALIINWSEKEFCKLIIKRTDFYKKDLKNNLDDYVNSIKKLFPDELFKNILSGIDTNRYHTNFYTYITALSFNRPRDFLKFCWILDKKIGSITKLEEKNITASEIEYSDYFINELKDELCLSSRLLNFKADAESINELLSTLSKNDKFTFGELKTKIAVFLSTRASKGVVVKFIENLWRYSIVGYKDGKEDKLIKFKYLDNTLSFPRDNEIVKKLVFFLHRGIYWTYKKN